MTSERHRGRYLADLTGPEIGERLTDRSIIVQPLGAIEQHGPHLPLSTDSVVATAVAEAAVAEVGDELDVVAAADAAVHEVQRARLVAGHGVAVGDHAAGGARRHRPLRRHHAGPAAGLPQRPRRQQRAAQRRQPRAPPDARPDDVPRPSRACRPTRAAPRRPSELGMGVHGGTDETSLMLHLAPHLVRHVAWPSGACPTSSPTTSYVRFGGRVSFGWLSNDFFPDGYIGDPTAATAERGARAVRRRGARRSARRSARSPRSTSAAERDADVDCHRPARSTSTGCGSASRRSARSARCTARTASAGCARLALTDADRDGRDLVVGWMRDLGLDVVDRRDRQRRRHPRRAPTRRGSR